MQIKFQLAQQVGPQNRGSISDFCTRFLRPNFGSQSKFNLHRQPPLKLGLLESPMGVLSKLVYMLVSNMVGTRFVWTKTFLNNIAPNVGNSAAIPDVQLCQDI